jgi:predicted adenine nucleotide alpha hydrolase (AANH) superfamily ATPase
MTTTLASSRWKSLDQINEAGVWACETANAMQMGDDCPEVLWWDRNWRKGGLQERRNAIIKEYGFYNQLWCGCEFSRKSSDF